MAEVRLERPPERLLVRRIGVGVEQADRHALDALAPGGAATIPVELGERERRQHGAVRTHPLGDLEAQAARHERLRLARAGRGGRDARGSCRAISSTSRKPRVVTRPTGRDAPLDDGVGDQWWCRGRARRRPRPGASSARRPFEHALRRGLSGVVGTLHERTSPVTSSTATRSVKVPPTSTPTRRRLTPGSRRPGASRRHVSTWPASSARDEQEWRSRPATSRPRPATGCGAARPWIILGLLQLTR